MKNLDSSKLAFIMVVASAAFMVLLVVSAIFMFNTSGPTSDAWAWVFASSVVVPVVGAALYSMLPE